MIILMSVTLVFDVIVIVFVVVVALDFKRKNKRNKQNNEKITVKGGRGNGGFSQ